MGYLFYSSFFFFLIHTNKMLGPSSAATPHYWLINTQQEKSTTGHPREEAGRASGSSRASCPGERGPLHSAGKLSEGVLSKWSSRSWAYPTPVEQETTIPTPERWLPRLLSELGRFGGYGPLEEPISLACKSIRRLAGVQQTGFPKIQVRLHTHLWIFLF